MPACFYTQIGGTVLNSHIYRCILELSADIKGIGRLQLVYTKQITANRYLLLHASFGG